MERTPRIPGSGTSLRLLHVHRALRLFHVKHGAVGSVFASAAVLVCGANWLAAGDIFRAPSHEEGCQGTSYLESYEFTDRRWMFHVEHFANAHVKQLAGGWKFKIRWVTADQVRRRRAGAFLCLLKRAASKNVAPGWARATPKSVFFGFPAGPWPQSRG